MSNMPNSNSKISSTREYAYMEIKEQIINGTLKPDENIIEEKLAENLNISRTPLREALHRLEWEELVERKQNGRLKVAPISIREIEELYSVRRFLECLMVVKATEKATSLDIEKLENIVDMASLAAKVGAVDEILLYGNKFHQFLYELSGHETAVKILYQLNDRIKRYKHLVPLSSRREQETDNNNHSKIVSCIALKDVSGAEEAMSKHINWSLEVSIQNIKAYQLEHTIKEEIK